MRTFKLVCLLLFSFVGTCLAQDDYLVKTTPKSSAAATSEEQFVENNFPFYAICDWIPGSKFMFVGEEKYNFIPLLKSLENERDVENSKFQHKILEFLGNEEMVKETYTGKSYSTRFLFECDGEKYYHEFKNQRLDDICINNSRIAISNLVYLGDIDIAREQLMGKILYTKTTSVRMDDPNSRGGFRAASVPMNQEVTVMAIGVGDRQFPVKIVFEDKNGSSYYIELAFSKTNSGLLSSDFTGERLYKTFPNVFSFENKDLKTTEDIKNKYVNRAVYPKRTLTVTKDDIPTALLRYTPLTIIDLSVSPGTTISKVSLRDREGEVYEADIDLKYNVIIKNDNFIDDVFGFGDLRRQYPSITEDNWQLITNGEIKVGMSKDECRLSLGSPIQIVKNTNSRYETWYYQGHVLDFEGNTLLRIK